MGKISIIQSLKEQLTDLELASTDLTGKTVIVTGANVGLGFEAAKHFAKMKPAKLILACRDMGRANEAVKHIQEASGLKGDEIVAWHLDLSQFSSVVAFANKFEAEGGGRLDLLVENAALSTTEFEKTQDGFERTIQINYLSNALLALLLLPSQLKTPSSGPTPRFVSVSSDAHHLLGPIKDSSDPKLLEKLSDKNYRTRSSQMSRRYYVSKLLALFFARSLTARLPPDTSLTVVSVNPGFCKSDLARNAKGVEKYALQFFTSLVARSSEMGSRTLVWAAVGGDKKVLQGKYLGSCKVSEESDWALGKDGLEMQENVWKQSIEVLKKISPQVESVIAEQLTHN